MMATAIMDDNRLIRLKDNQNYENAYLLVEKEYADCDAKEIPERFWKGMEPLRSVKKESFLDEHKIVSIPPPGKNTAVFDKVNDKLYTYNWVGVVSSRISKENSEEIFSRIEINSRFDEGEKQYFLLYLLCSFCGINAFDLDIKSANESNYTIVLAMVFLSRLIDAYGEGLYKAYKEEKYNDFSFRGTFDINRHLLINNPFVGKTAYTLREHSYDNEVLCLIRQAIEYIEDYYPDILYSFISYNPVLKEMISVVETATPSFRFNYNYSESVKCRREITNPLYQHYEEARRLALMLLKESGQNIFDDSEEESFGVLIDISWLWEEFIAIKLLGDTGYRHMVRGNASDSLLWAEGENWYPDFIENKSENERRNIFDAKYKFWKWNKDEDVHQLLSYLFLTGGEICGVIYPNEQEEDFTHKDLKAFSSFYETPAKIFRMPFFVPPSNDAVDYNDYCKKFEESIAVWKSKFKEIVHT